MIPNSIRRVVTGFALLLATSAAWAEDSTVVARERELRWLYEGSRASGRYLRPAAAKVAQLDAFRDVFEAWAAKGLVPAGDMLRPCGFEAVPAEMPGAAVRVVRERTGSRSGGGIYFLAEPPASGNGLVLQIPHTFTERTIGKVGVALLAAGNPTGLFINTVPRTSRPRPGENGDPAELTRAGNYFHAATEGLAKGLPNTVFVQMHRFAGRPWRHDLADRDFVLADGMPSDRPGPLLDVAARAFQREYGEAKVAVYGRQTRSLGARQNAQAAMLNRKTPGRFLQLMISASLGDRLAESEIERARLWRTLSALVSGRPPADTRDGAESASRKPMPRKDSR